MKRLEAEIYGHVTGVFFRDNILKQAEELGITGWVRNREDKSVQVVAEGSESGLQQLLQFLHKGPPLADVKNVKCQWLAATGEFDEFVKEPKHFVIE